MFGLRLITKRELLLFAATIKDLREEIERQRKMIDHERKRAEGAINLLLIRTQKAAIIADSGPTIEEQDKLNERQFDIFGDGASYDEAKALEELQS